jgi:hypothetical protein
MTALLLTLVLAVEPAGCQYEGATRVVCTTPSFQLLMDGMDAQDAALAGCELDRVSDRRGFDLKLRTAKELHGAELMAANARAAALERLLRENAPKPPSFMEANLPALVWTGGALGVTLVSLGVALAAGDASPAMWGSFLGGGVILTGGSGFLALSEP